MISIDDIIGMTDLTRAEVDAIAEHEHVPEVAAAALASYLMHAPHGPAKIREMITDDIRKALWREDRDHAAKLLAALKHFIAEHPEAARR